MNIFLVRHAKYDNPEKIYPYHLPLVLSEEGRQQAKKIGQWFKDNNFMNLPIYTSPIVRTRETAEIIASITDSKIYEDEDLTEVRWNKLQGKPMPKDNDWSECYKPGIQEDPASIFARTKKVFDKRVKENKDSILVTHGDNITLLYCFLENRIAPRELDKFSLYIDKAETLFVKVLGGGKFDIKRIRVY